MDATLDAVPDSFSQRLQRRATFDIARVPGDLRHVDRIVRGEQGGEAAVVAFRDDLIDHRVLPFGLSAFPKLINSENWDFEEGPQHLSFALTLVKPFPQGRDKMREFDEFAGDSFLERQIADDGREQMGFSCSDIAIEQETLVTSAETGCEVVELEVNSVQVANLLSTAIHVSELVKRGIMRVFSRDRRCIERADSFVERPANTAAAGIGIAFIIEQKLEARPFTGGTGVEAIVTAFSSRKISYFRDHVAFSVAGIAQGLQIAE